MTSRTPSAPLGQLATTSAPVGRVAEVRMPKISARLNSRIQQTLRPVSYTHLTLPTILLV
eukprot:2423004-Amphidinium_carterae.1